MRSPFLLLIILFSIHALSSHARDFRVGDILPDVYIGRPDGMMNNADKINKLPGQPEVNFDQYAGYVTVDPSAGRSLFYYFVESPQDPCTKPLVLWLNGGPGCSSLGMGGFSGSGPFRPNSDEKTLHQNEYAWNHVANVIYLESPSGVGFSYSKTGSDIEATGDNRTAHDNYIFLLNWLERFPQYKSRDLYVTGESYAGHYVPQLAHTIIANNKVTNRTVINLKGAAIGNGLIDDDAISRSRWDFFHGHALISDETYQALLSNCPYEDKVRAAECDRARSLVLREIGDIEQYNIYSPDCRFDAPVKSEFDPCTEDYAETYLNLPEVQRALHVAQVPYTWEKCSDDVTGNWTDRPENVLSDIQAIIANGIRFLMYSGDLDPAVPFTANRYAIKKLGLSVETSWRQWYAGDEVGGYFGVYKGLTFATIRGAGHLVPSDKPKRSLTLISSFIQGTPPPTKNHVIIISKLASFTQMKM